MALLTTRLLYPDLDTKAAALLHSLARDLALVDGNKRLALAGVVAFCGVNGRRRFSGGCSLTDGAQAPRC